jgi:hypothetical protein
VAVLLLAVTALRAVETWVRVTVDSAAFILMAVLLRGGRLSFTSGWSCPRQTIDLELELALLVAPILNRDLQNRVARGLELLQQR